MYRQSNNIREMHIMRSMSFKVTAPTVFAVTAWMVFIGAMLAAAPLHAGSDITRLFDAGASTDGCGSDWDSCRDRMLEGAASAVSDDGNTPGNGDTGGHVTVNVSGGTYAATVGATGDTSDGVYRFSQPLVGLSDPWSTGILAASFGVDGRLQTNVQSLYNGGNGGAVDVTVGLGSHPVVRLGGNLPDPAILSGRLTLSGVMALSQGGVNSYFDAGSNNYYSESGDGGEVRVDFTGSVVSDGSYGAVIGQEIGISAISRGGSFRCIDEDCDQNYKAGFNYNLPGAGGSVSVALHAVPGVSEITLQDGSAIGVMAVSANGAIIADQEGATFNVDASSVRAGTVTVDVDAGVDILVGNDDALVSAGILALSAGSELTVPLYYQNSDVTLRASGGTAYGNDVRVSNNGDITARGSLALGIAALSVNGQAAVGFLAIGAPGVIHRKRNAAEVEQTLGRVEVSNTGVIATSGTASHGIVAMSGGSGGLTLVGVLSDQLLPDPLDIQGNYGDDDDGDGVLNKDEDWDGDDIANALDADDDGDGLLDNYDFDRDGVRNFYDTDDDADGVPDTTDDDDDNDGLKDDGACVTQASAKPLCDGIDSEYALGGDASGVKGVKVNGGEVVVTNTGSITTGRENAADRSAHAVGILAQSIGGAGGAGYGGWFFGFGDDGGGGGNGGHVTVSNSGDIRTHGTFATAILAQSLGGGGGTGGTSYLASWIALGGSGGAGGNAGQVSVNLAGPGRIETVGDFAQGVLAQATGAGGGSSGSADAYGTAGTISVGGDGGIAGNGGAVSVIASDDENDAALQRTDWRSPWIDAPVDIDATALDLVTWGDHGTGVLAQSTGGGGGTGGAAQSKSWSVAYNLNLSFGGRGGAAGVGAAVSVKSDIDISTAGENAVGILAQSTGGGGGSGGAAYSHAFTVEIPLDDYPNVTYVGAWGGNGGTGNHGGRIDVQNGGLIWTSGEAAAGVFAQSLGGGGGTGGTGKAVSRILPLAFKQTGKTLAINVTTSVGGDGGAGGDGAEVIVHNGVDATDSGGVIVTAGADSAGIFAQSIGGGGGNGSLGKVTQGGAVWLKFLENIITTVMPPTSPPPKQISLNVDVGVGGKGGAAGQGGSVAVFNGALRDLTPDSLSDANWQVTPGHIQTSEGNSPGVMAQSIGGGGGNAGGGEVNGTGGLIQTNIAVGGRGGAAGDGAEVTVENPLGATIRTGWVETGAVTDPEALAGGMAPYLVITHGTGSAGILAQSIGGGGGTGGGADASATLTSFGFNDVSGTKLRPLARVLNEYIAFAKAIKKFEEKGDYSYFIQPNVTFNLSVGGDGGAGGVGGPVRVDNGGAIDTYGEFAHGIQAQSVGGGGGNGGAVESISALWTDPSAAEILDLVLTFNRIRIPIHVGGGGGVSGDGGSVTVTHSAGGSILTHGYAAHGIFAQSIGGGGGYVVNPTAGLNGEIEIGGSSDDPDTKTKGSWGRGGAVNVQSAGTVETWGDDAAGILAQSIGGGGGAGAAGCTNSAAGSMGADGQWQGATPCWGNNASQDGVRPQNETWTTPVSLMMSMGGGRIYGVDTEIDGGLVTVTVSDAVVTHGKRSMGVVAQSIGGGGGFFSNDATAFALTSLAPNAGYSHSHGAAVTVSIDEGGSITTTGDGAWGVLAQSIGGSGGFVGDPSLDLGLLVSNTVDTVCCEYYYEDVVDPFIGDPYVGWFTGQYTTGADGGAVTVNLAGGTSIITTGRNAHGIVAQSVGGGGGIAAGYANDRNALVYMGNPGAIDWGAVTPPDQLPLGRYETAFTGQGGTIDIDIAAGATVAALGEGSIGILAQSSGDKNFQSKISITVAGTVSGGSGYAPDATNADDLSGPAAIVVSGGESRRNQHDAVDTPNTITVTGTGKVYGHTDAYGNADVNAMAIRSIYGFTDVRIQSGGVVAGGIILGTSATDPDRGSVTIDSGGNWIPGPYSRTATQSVHNHGLIVVTQPSVLEGSLKHYADGEILLQLDPSVHFDQPALTVTGLARLEGKITPVVDNLLSGEFRLLKAGTLEFSPSIDDPFLFDWAQRITADSELRLSALADFRPAGSRLSANQEQAAIYLERAWESADPYLAGHFAYMLRMDSAAQHGGMLDALGSAELLHRHAATLQAIPTLLGDAIDCPTMGGADLIVGEDSCAWMGVGQSWGRYTGKDTRKNDTDADLFSFGLQKEFRPGWYLSGVIGRLSSDADAGPARSSGRSTIGSLGVKHQRGNWILGASLAWGEGSYDSVRSFALPLAGGGASAPESVLRSDSEMDIGALRARVSYEFDLEGAYLRPTLDVDALQTETSGFDEESGEHLFRLSGDGDSTRELVVTPHVEMGGVFDLGGENRLRAYIDAGVRLAPDADREMDVRISGADASIGFMRNRMDVPLATGLLKVGAQIYRNEALDLRLEYGLEANDSFRNETATARVAWHF